MQKITFFRNKYVMKNKITFIAIILAANICHAQIEFYSGNNFKFPVKDGKEKTIYIYNVCDHQECYKEVGSQAISYTKIFR